MSTLQEWYRQINGTYLDRNFYRSLESIFAHLVEVSRGLSVAATTRRKRGVNAEEFLPKTIAWWLAVCGRAGIPDVGQMIWAKFPARCPYCQLKRHEGDKCKEADSSKKEVDWSKLREYGDEAEMPRTLAEWQLMFQRIYPRHDGTDHETNISRLAEEMGELAEAVRALPLAPQYFIAEAPDVFAWLMGFANQYDFDRPTAPEDYGVALSSAMEHEYPGYCKLCERQVCKCPPIPASTLGRIAKEAPLDTIKPGRLFTLQESIALFRKAEQSIVIGNAPVTATPAELEKIHSDTQKILEQLSLQTDWQPLIAVKLAAALGGLEKLTKQGEITQVSIDEVAAILKSLPSDSKQQVKSFINNLAASSTFSGLMMFLQ